MWYTSVDKWGELILGFDFCVKDVIGHIYELQQFHLLSMLIIVLYFEGDVPIISEVINI